MFVTLRALFVFVATCAALFHCWFSLFVPLSRRVVLLLLSRVLFACCCNVRRSLVIATWRCLLLLSRACAVCSSVATCMLFDIVVTCVCCLPFVVTCVSCLISLLPRALFVCSPCLLATLRCVLK